MGISMAALMESDEELRRFEEHPQELEALLNRAISGRGDGMLNLLDTWEGVHCLVTSEGPNLPMAALKTGEVVRFAVRFDRGHVHHAGCLFWDKDSFSSAAMSLGIAV